jgi:hypothetical protein
MWAYQIITNNTCPSIDVALQLVSRLHCTVRIFLCLQVIFVKIDDTISVRTCLICEDHRQNKGRVDTLLNKPGL